MFGHGMGKENLHLIFVDLSWDSWAMGRSKRKEERKLKKQAKIRYFWKIRCSIHPVHRYTQSSATKWSPIFLKHPISHYVTLGAHSIHGAFSDFHLSAWSPKGEDVDSDDGLHDIVKPKKKKPKKEKVGKIHRWWVI